MFLRKKIGKSTTDCWKEIEKLETISGLSAEEAKERMIESLKEEAKTQAQSFINDIMDDAKLTASKMKR